LIVAADFDDFTHRLMTHHIARVHLGHEATHEMKV
jgi:hypothetical protein